MARIFPSIYVSLEAPTQLVAGILGVRHGFVLVENLTHYPSF